MPENEFAAAAQTDAAIATGTAGMPDPAADNTNAAGSQPDDQATNEAVTEAVTGSAANQAQTLDEDEEITYHAVQKDNNVTAIWEMQGRKHLRTIDPRSREGSEILSLFSAEEGEEQAA